MALVFDNPTQPTGGVVFDEESDGGVVFDRAPESRSYDTALSPVEEIYFARWKTANAPNDSGLDYDLRGAYKAGLTPSSNGHWPDTFKKPNHPTFSNQSIYANDDPSKAGSWDGENYIPPATVKLAPDDLAIRAYNPTLLDRTRNFLAPISNIVEKLSTVPEGMPQIPEIPQAYGTLMQLAGDKTAGAAAGVANSLIGVANMAPTPVGAVVGLGGLPARLAGAALSPIMAQSAADNFQPTLDTIADPSISTQEKFKAGTNEIATALGAVAPLAELGALRGRLASKTPEQATKAIREEIKVTEDKRISDALTDAADQLDREIAARDAVEAQAKAQQKAATDAQKAQADAQQAVADQQAAAMEVPKSTQILQESAKPPVLANVATEAGTQTSPFALQGKLNEITAAPEPVVDPALAQVAPETIAPVEPVVAVKAKPTRAPVEFLSHETIEGFPEMWNLTADIPPSPQFPNGAKAGSTVSRIQLEEAGFKVPKAPKPPKIAEEIKDAVQEQSTGEIPVREAPQVSEGILGANAVDQGVAPVRQARDIALEEASRQPEVAERLNNLSESKLTALADQLGINPMGFSGGRLRARIESNARPEIIADAIANPTPPVPKRGKVKGSKADKWADKIIGEGRALSGFDPELLAAHTIKLVGQLETGAVQFADWSAQKLKEVGEEIRPYLQQIWDRANEQIAAKPGQRVMTGDERGTSRSALGKYDYVTTSNAAQIEAAKPILDYVKQTGDYEGGFAKLRQIENSADRAVAAASMIESAEQIADPFLRDRTVARLFREAKGVGTDVAQGLQAQGTVNELIAPYRGHLAWMDILQSRRAEEVAPKFPEDSAARINNGMKDAGNVAADQLATDTPGVSSVLKGAISRVKKSVAIDWRKVFTDLPERQAERKAEIFKRINEDPKVAALPESARQKLADAMEAAWEDLRNKEFRKEFEKVIELPNVGKAEKEALKKSLPNLIEQANLGMLDNEAFLNELGKQYGIEGIDSATGKKLRDLGQLAARTAEGSKRNEVFQQIMDTIMEARGVNPWDFLKDYWYRNVMSAPRTAVEIGAGGVIQGAARTYTTAVDTAVAQGRPDLALRMIGMFLKDSATGVRLGADLVKTGDRAILPRYTEQFLAKMKNLEEGKSPGGEIESMYRRAGPLGKAALAPFEMTGRVLTGLDYIGGQGVRSQQMLYSALTRGDKVSFDAAMKRFNANESAAARQKAVDELGPKARPAQIIARTREILNEGISKDIQDFGNTMTEVTALNAPPVGLGGEVYKALSKLPMVVRAPAGLAFAKAGINIFQELTNWGPITGQINMARSLWRNPSKNNPLRFLALDKLPPERARQLVVAQATGLAVLTAAANKFLPDQPEDKEGKPRKWDISGSWNNLTPAQKSALMSAGERPLSIKLPDGRWIDYKLTPFMAALGTIGHWRDQQRFNAEKWNDEEIMNKVGNAWLAGLGSVKDLSLASQFSRAAGLLAADDRSLDTKGFERMISDSVGNTAVGLIPMSSMLRELDNTTDPQRYRPDKTNPGVDLWLSQVPFVRRWVGETEDGQSKPLLNFLGEPVRVETNPLNRHIGSAPSTAPVEAALSQKVGLGMKLPVMSDNTTVVDKDAKTRPMTGEEAYTYQKAVRQAFARQIAMDLPAFQQATPEQAALYSQQVFTAAQRYARDRMNTGIRVGEMPADPKLSSALTPEYEAVKAADSAEGSESALNAARMRVQYDALQAMPPDQRNGVLRELAMKQPEVAHMLLQHAASRATGRTALERATSGLSAEARGEYYAGELAKRPNPQDKQAFLKQQLAAGLINKEVLRQLILQSQKN